MWTLRKVSNGVFKSTNPERIVPSIGSSPHGRCPSGLTGWRKSHNCASSWAPQTWSTWGEGCTYWCQCHRQPPPPHETLDPGAKSLDVPAVQTFRLTLVLYWVRKCLTYPNIYQIWSFTQISNNVFLLSFIALLSWMILLWVLQLAAHFCLWWGLDLTKFDFAA